jgi:hypothetical protein
VVYRQKTAVKLLLSAIKRVDGVIRDRYNNAVKDLWKIIGSVNIAVLFIDIWIGSLTRAVKFHISDVDAIPAMDCRKLLEVLFSSVERCSKIQPGWLSQWMAGRVFCLREINEMGVIGLALLGVVLGAAGTEVLRAKKPEMIKKIEDAAKRFVDSLCPSDSDDEEKQK